MTTLMVFAGALASAVGLAAFCWPRHALRRAAIAAAVAVIGPFVLGFLLNPFLGAGAGMGVVFMLTACSATILLAAASAVAGAILRQACTALRV